MSLTWTLLALLGFVVLTAGTAVFVAAEFSLTALERSTVDANARTGPRRAKLAPPGAFPPAVGPPSGHLDHAPVHGFPCRAAARATVPPRVHGAVADEELR